MLGRNGAQKNVVLDFKITLRSQRDNLKRSALTLEWLPCTHHRAQMRLKFRMTHTSTNRNARLAIRAIGHMCLATNLLEVTLAEPVGQAAQVIHVCVRERDRGGTQRRARALPHVKHEVKLGNLNDGLFARDADALYSVRGHIKEAKLAFA